MQSTVNMKTKLNLKYVFIIGSLILTPLLILLNLYFTAKQRQTKISPPQSISVASISGTPTPDINIFTGLPNPQLTIDWGTTSPSFVASEYLSYHTTPATNNNEAISVAQTLGFSEANKKDLGSGDFIWNKGPEILLYIATNDSLDYQNQTKYSGNTTFNETELKRRASQIANSLFPKLNLVLSSVNYLSDDTYYSPNVDIKNSKYAEINFDQTVNGTLLLPGNLSAAHFLTIYMYPNYSISNFKKAPGYLSLTPTSKKSTPNIDRLKTIPANYFRKITPLPIDREAQINYSKQIVLSVKTIDIRYTIIGSTASPLYYIEGTLYADKIKVSDSVGYVAPMD